jgi:hypothetical protein
MAKKHDNKHTIEADEVDKFLSTLPSLRIPDDLFEDSTFVPLKTEKRKTDVAVIFAMIAWFFLLFALLMLTRAFPSRIVFFHAYTGTVASAAMVDTQIILYTIIYLVCNGVVCAGGLGICALRKKKLFRGIALNYWIAGGLSLIIAALLLIRY